VVSFREKLQNDVLNLNILIYCDFVHCRNPSGSRQPGKLSWCDRGWHGSCNWFMGQLPENLELKDP
jgi:hypothetical protein